MSINPATTIMLSYEQMNFVKNSLIESFDIEIAKLELFDSGKDSSLVVIEYIMNLCSEDHYKFFIMQSINDKVESVFTNAAIRDFVLNLTDRFSFLISCKDYYLTDELINSITASVTLNKPRPDSDLSLINDELLETLYMPSATIRELLKDNFWLITLYLLVMVYTKTNLYNVSIAFKENTS